MADEVASLLSFNDIDELGAGGSRVASFSTDSRREMVAFVEAVVLASGDVGDTIDFTFYETNDPSDAASYRQIATATQITGTSSGSVLKQKISLSDLNYNTFIVVKADASATLTAGDKLTAINCYMGYNKKI